MSPEDDPLGSLLALDFHALQAKEYEWLETFYSTYKKENVLDNLPNWDYNYALVKFLQNQGVKYYNKRTVISQFMRLGNRRGG